LNADIPALFFEEIEVKLVLLIVVLVGVGVCLGWFHFSSSNDTGKPNVTFSVDKNKIEADKNKVVDKIQDMEHKPVDRTTTTTQKAQD
jgi:predicted negative regulator of RcsB-dependent stress response